MNKATKSEWRSVCGRSVRRASDMPEGVVTFHQRDTVRTIKAFVLGGFAEATPGECPDRIKLTRVHGLRFPLVTEWKYD